MPVTKVRRKPVRLNPVQHFKLIGIILASTGRKISEIIQDAKEEGITQVNENHVRGIAKAHGVKLEVRTRGHTPVEKAEKARLSYMALCNEADIDPLDFLPSGSAATPDAAGKVPG